MIVHYFDNDVTIFINSITNGNYISVDCKMFF